MINNTVDILFRLDQDNNDEYIELYDVVENSKFDDRVCQQRTHIRHNSLVIGRYSVLPYYKELQKDIEFNKSKLINSYDEHRWIADFEYYSVLKDYTFETWQSKEFPYIDYEGPFVVKGVTNSKKFRWDKMMFAKDRRTATEIFCELKQDPVIGTQDIIFRKYEPLKTFEVGINGMRFTNEWRVFCLGDKILSSGFYWTCAKDAEEINRGGIPREASFLVSKLASIICNYTNFYAVDIAEKENGDWVMVEINDGQMSGLSMNDAKFMYSNLLETIHNKQTKNII